MRRIMFPAILVVVFAAAAAAGRFGLGLGLSFYQPAEEGSSFTPIYNANAYYWANRNVVPSLSVGYSRYTISGTTYNYLPIIPRVTYHFRTTDWFDPYTGAGVVYARRWWNGTLDGDANSWGYTGLVGANFAVSDNFGFGLGVEYVVPDAGHFDTGYPGFTISLGAGGF